MITVTKEIFLCFILTLILHETSSSTISITYKPHLIFTNKIIKNIYNLNCLFIEIGWCCALRNTQSSGDEMSVNFTCFQLSSIYGKDKVLYNYQFGSKITYYILLINYKMCINDSENNYRNENSIRPPQKDTFLEDNCFNLCNDNESSIHLSGLCTLCDEIYDLILFDTQGFETKRDRRYDLKKILFAVRFLNYVEQSSSQIIETHVFSKRTETKKKRVRRYVNLRDTVVVDEFVGIPWQSLLLLLPPRPQNCQLRDTILSQRYISHLMEGPSWLKNQQDEPVGSCPAHFTLNIDMERIWPRVIIRTECMCEGSRCARRGAHVCVTVYISRTVIKRNFLRMQEVLPVGCLCAVKRAMISKPPRPRIDT